MRYYSAYAKCYTYYNITCIIDPVFKIMDIYKDNEYLYSESL